MLWPSRRSPSHWDTPTRVPVKQATLLLTSGVVRNTSSGSGPAFDCSPMASTPSPPCRHCSPVAPFLVPCSHRGAAIPDRFRAANLAGPSLTGVSRRPALAGRRSFALDANQCLLRFRAVCRCRERADSLCHSPQPHREPREPSLAPIGALGVLPVEPLAFGHQVFLTLAFSDALDALVRQPPCGQPPTAMPPEMSSSPRRHLPFPDA